ncbi:MAG TPA: glycosyltransferase [Aquihabitans sp.]|nr:glycosyltransferase [Aquihabitans sp.]
MSAPVLAHLTTTDMSLELLLGPQLEAFAAAGFRVVGVSADGPYVATLRDRGIEHVALAHSTRAMAPHRDVRAVAELAGVLGRLRPDVLHTHNPKPGLYGRVVGRARRVPVVVNTVHGLYALPEDPWPKRAVVYGLERLAATCSQAELVQNPEDLAVLRRLGVPDERLVLLGNGIDLARFDPRRVDATSRARARAELGATGPDDVVVGLVGRLVREKGYPEVFAAADALRTRCPTVRFAAIGPDEPDKGDGLGADDRALAERAGVRLLGHRRDVEALYPGMDVFVLASHREGFPRAAMEAAAMGVPVIATDIRGCRQVVDPDATGLLVTPRDPAALADAVAALADDPDRRARFAAAGRAKAEREFDQQHCIDTTLATYDRLLRRAGGRLPAGAA